MSKDCANSQARRDALLNLASPTSRSASTSLRRMPRFTHGTAMIEALIALPILIVVILGAIQFALIYQAKATLNHASLQAARAGAVAHADPQALRRGLARGLLPLESPDSSLEGVAAAALRLEADVTTSARIRILNPTREAFADFAEEVNGVREIPNDRLYARATTLGTQSGLNIQDANLLRVEVTYGYELSVPLVNWFITRTLLAMNGRQPIDAFEQQLLRRTLLPIVSTATVRMHSPARMSGLVVARDDLPDAARIPADARPADSDDADPGSEEQDGEQSETGASSRDDSSSLGDGFFGFGEGRADPIDNDDPGGDDGGSEGTGDEDPDEGNSGTGRTEPQEPPLCTPEESNSDDEDEGVLGSVWNALQGMAGPAIDFVRGFWDGIKGQIGDLVHAIGNPIETAEGLYELARAFIDEPAETARLIGQALGTDLEQLAFCGAYDKGRVLGSYLSPAFMMKLALKLARFGRAGLARSVEETKLELGCASFARGTPVWMGDSRRPIEQIATDQLVDSRAAFSYTDVQQPVLRVFSRTASSYRFLQTESDQFAITDEHPLWIQGRGWTAAKDIEVGAAVATLQGDTLVIANSAIDDSIEVHNFSVADTESYFVGIEGVWAHNAGCAVRIRYVRPRSLSNFQIGASDGGAGQWRSIPRPNTDAYRYQERITGAPRGVEYNVNGVDFDGYDADRNVLLDAKHWTQECPLGDRCRYEPLKQRMADKLMEEAESQIRAVLSSGTRIEWRVVDEEMALRISSILDEGLDEADRGHISVIYTPITDIVD
jgi:hypothetical protein